MSLLFKFFWKNHLIIFGKLKSSQSSLGFSPTYLNCMWETLISFMHIQTYEHVLWIL